MKKTPYILYALMRKLFVISGGKSNDILNNWISKKRPFSLDKPIYNGVLGSLTKDDVTKAVESIDRNGYHIFDAKLSEEKIQKIVEFSKTTQVEICGLNKIGKLEDHPGQPRYNILPDDIVTNAELCELITDETLKAIAGSYLNAHPICDLVAMWWSYPSTKNRSAAAQEFHFDMDRLKFIKFFFYLTDVTLETGPHCYIEGTHKKLPWRFRRDGRFGDAELIKYYGDNRIKKLIGKKGTIMAVDTRGFHKGEPLIADNRLIFQIEFSNSLFGMYYPASKIESIHSKSKEIFAADARTYLQIFE